MKLFTEEQMKEDYDGGCNDHFNDYIKSVASIELPSNDEAFKESIKIMEEWYGSGCKEEIDAHFRGIKWVIDKIKNQNK